MEIRILYFASLRERLERAEEQLELDEPIRSIGDLRTYLAARGGEWPLLLAPTTRSAVGQMMAEDATALKDGIEVAFFPPVTGG